MLVVYDVNVVDLTWSVVCMSMQSVEPWLLLCIWVCTTKARVSPALTQTRGKVIFQERMAVTNRRRESNTVSRRIRKRQSRRKRAWSSKTEANEGRQQETQCIPIGTRTHISQNGSWYANYYTIGTHHASPLPNQTKTWLVDSARQFLYWRPCCLDQLRIQPELET